MFPIGVLNQISKKNILADIKKNNFFGGTIFLDYFFEKIIFHVKIDCRQ